MKYYHIYFFIFKFIILIMLILGSLKIIKKNTKLFILIETIFRISLGLFLILFFLLNKIPGIDTEDRLIIIVSGVVMLLLINYKQIYEELSSKKVKTF